MFYNFLEFCCIKILTTKSFMKKNYKTVSFIKNQNKKRLLLLILIINIIFFKINTIQAQEILDFKNSVINNGGANLAVGTQYRFQNVGVEVNGNSIDALVTIAAKSPNATLIQFDDNVEPFTAGNSDFRPIVQNSLNTPIGNVDGDYVEFFFEFVLNSDNSNIALVDTNAYSMDIDGSENGLREYVILSGFNSYIFENPTELIYIPNGRFEASTDFNNPDITPDSRFLAKTSHSFISTFTYRAGVLRDSSNDVLGRLFAMAFEPLPFQNPNEVILIDAVNDDFTAISINGDTGGSTPSVFNDNGNGQDIVNDNPATNANVSNNINIVDNNGLNGATINNDGTIVIPPGTISGIYNLLYQICTESDNTLCDIAIATIQVITNPSPCDEIIPLGNPSTQVDNNDITWNFTGVGPAGDIILNGFSVAGEPNAFTNLITPDNVIVSVQNLNASKKIILNGATLSDGNDGLAVFSSFVLAEAQDVNLNHYLKYDNGNGGTVQGDHVDYLYTEPIISARNRFVLATERGGNNTSSTQALDINGNPIGIKALNIPGSNYAPTGATHENGQLVMATVFPLTALVPRGTLIYGIRYQQEDNGDGADGQAFIMRDPATIGCTITAEDDDFSGTPFSAGGITPSVFLNNGNGVDDANGSPATNANIANNISITNDGGLTGVTINPDGTINIPNNATPGNYTIEYQICLDIDDTKCDTATVTLIIDNNAPIAVDDNATTTVDNPVNVPVLDNDNDPDGNTITVTDINGTAVTPGDGVQVPVTGGTATLLTDGTIEVTPTAGSTTPISFPYTIDDGNGGTDTATVNVTINALPDFGPTIFTSNTNIIGTTGVVDFRVLVGEFGNGSSNGVSNVELRIIKNAELLISFDDTLTTLNGQPVQNSEWQYDATHPSLHKFIYIGNGGIFNASTAKFLGINAVYNPPTNTNGSFPLKTTIKFFSGGETNNSNNDDIDIIEYNNN
jgi:hypothetical protein